MSSAANVRQSDVPRIMRYRRVQNGNIVSRRGLIAADYDSNTKSFRVGYSLCRLTDRFDNATAISIAKTRMDRNDIISVSDVDRIDRLRRNCPYVLRNTLEDVLSTIQHMHDKVEAAPARRSARKAVSKKRK